MRRFILLADAHKALFLETDGLKISNVLGRHSIEELGITHNRPENKEGLNYKTSAGSHFFDPHSDAKEVERSQFAHKIGAMASEVVWNEKYDEVFIVAEPKMLGELKSHLTDFTRERVTKEISKNLLKEDLDKIQATIFA